MPVNRTELGVGCFHFEVPTAGLDTEKWAREVRRVLEAVPSVRAVEIEEPIPGLMGEEEDEEIYFSPHPQSGHVSFGLTIPRRMQEEVWAGSLPAGVSEDFAVSIFYGDYFPVTFITFLGQSDGVDASGGVVIVREFLRRELRRLGAEVGEVGFVVLGPSPFHANFTFLPSSPEELEGDPGIPGISYAKKPQLGYPDVLIRYDSTRYSSGEDAISAFVPHVIHQLSYFYQLIRLRNRRMFHAVAIRNRVTELVHIHQASGLKGWWWRMFQAGRLTRELILTAVGLSFRHREEIRRSRESFEHIFEAAKLPMFRTWLESEMTDAYRDELNNCREVAELLEPRRLREVNALLVLVVAAVSAVLGAFASHLLG